jgi:hypothetical protein
MESQSSTLLDRAIALVQVDFDPPHRQPSPALVIVATVLSIGGSLAADVALVAMGKAVFPATSGYVHFQFHDYARLTVIGVVIACAAWPIVARISSAPRWLFFRMAIVVTLVLLLPDFYLLAKGQPPKAVAVLMAMHLAIAIVTYNCLVHLARVRSPRTEFAMVTIPGDPAKWRFPPLPEPAIQDDPGAILSRPIVNDDQQVLSEHYLPGTSAAESGRGSQPV